MFNGLGWEVIFRWVDIGAIVDHYCLRFLFTMTGKYSKYVKVSYSDDPIVKEWNNAVKVTVDMS